MFTEPQGAHWGRKTRPADAATVMEIRTRLELRGTVAGELGAGGFSEKIEVSCEESLEVFARLVPVGWVMMGGRLGWVEEKEEGRQRASEIGIWLLLKTIRGQACGSAD